MQINFELYFNLSIIVSNELLYKKIMKQNEFYNQKLIDFNRKYSFELKSKVNRSITSFYITNGKKKYDLTTSYFEADVEKVSQGILQDSLFNLFAYLNKVTVCLAFDGLNLTAENVKSYNYTLPIL